MSFYALYREWKGFAVKLLVTVPAQQGPKCLHDLQKKKNVTRKKKPFERERGGEKGKEKKKQVRYHLCKHTIPAELHSMNFNKLYFFLIGIYICVCIYISICLSIFKFIHTFHSPIYTLLLSLTHTNIYTDRYIQMYREKNINPYAHTPPPTISAHTEGQRNVYS